RFSCQKCDHTMNADLNAALNIAQKAKINPPIAV
ncbi:MAG: zinc ribbon domain-containing protein, partial [Leptospirillum sp.]